MGTPNIATITSSLERSFQNCSLNHQQSSGSGGGGVAAQPISDSPENQSLDATLELNSQASLPHNWEQCLDLKTGEVYYINWRTGMKAKEDPRTMGECSGDYYSEDEEEDDDDDEDDDSEGSSCSSSREQWSGNNNKNGTEDYYYNVSGINGKDDDNNVLVVGGCKSCLMYYMVPKQLQVCPKCCGQLLHFDRQENVSL